MDWMFEKIFDWAMTTRNYIIIAYVVYVIFLYVLYLLIFRNHGERTAYLKNLRGVICAGCMILTPVLFIPFLRQGARVILLFLACEASACVCLFLPTPQKWKMDRIYKHENNPIRRYEKLDKIRDKRLTPREKKVLMQRQAFTLYELGSLKKAMSLLEECEAPDAPVRIMLEAILTENKGNLPGAQKLMLKAWSNCSSSREEHYHKVQILNNIGRTYRISGNLQEALTYYKKGIDELKLPAEDVIAEHLYTNYIFTLGMLKKPWEEIDEWIGRYAATLDMKKPENKVKISNIIVAAAKQKGEEEIWREQVLTGFDRMIGEAIRPENRLVFTTSSLRLAFTGGLNFIPPLEVLRKSYQELLKLEMPARYFAIKEIHILFRPETGAPVQVLQYYPQLNEFACSYIREQAARDIEAYIGSLPIEAVLERCFMRMELAGIQKYLAGYSLQKTAEILLSVRDAYETNGLILDAVRASVNLADEHFWISNLDKGFMPTDRAALEDAMRYAEERMDHVQLHPDVADIFMQLAWMHIRLHQYGLGCKYAELFDQCRLADEHFAPWMRIQMETVRIMQRVMKLKDKLEKLRTDPAALQSLSPSARLWMQNYPGQVHPLDVSLLWGGLLGFDPVFIKRKVWMGIQPNGEIGPKEHYWLAYPRILDAENRVCADMLEFDLSGGDQILFVPGQHPMESGEALILRQDLEATGMSFPLAEKQTYPFPRTDPNGQRNILEEIRTELVANPPEISSCKNPEYIL